MGIPVKLDVFEGPLDLLLHLIEKNKIDIYDIPIVVITEQYLEYIKNMQENDIEVLSEFLVMAATLIRIKSKMLLPPDDEDEEDAQDPRTELVERLLEYKLYKYASFELKDRRIEASRTVFKNKDLPKEVSEWREVIDTKELLDGITMQKLQSIFEFVIRRREDKVDPIRSKFGKIEKEEITVDDRLVYVEDYAKRHKKFSFFNLLDMQKNKTMVIVTFLAVLELMKTGVLQIKQEQPFDDIIISYNDKSGGTQ